MDLGVPSTLYAACANDGYRKPRTGMWEFMRADPGHHSSIDILPCVKRVASQQAEVERDVFMVGDAAGRERDHSDCDVHFCENLGVPFFTPEEFFLGDKTQVVGHKFDPSWYLPVSLGGSSVPKPSEEIQSYCFSDIDSFHSFETSNSVFEESSAEVDSSCWSARQWEDKLLQKVPSTKRLRESCFTRLWNCCEVYKLCKEGRKSPLGRKIGESSLPKQILESRLF